MPTTQNEAEKIVKICRDEQVPVDKLARICHRLRDEVGEPSDNDSVKQTMRMLSVLVDSLTFDTSAKPVENGWLLAWGAMVTSHFILWFAMWTACVLSIWEQPWYMAMIVISFCVYLVSVDVVCPITVWENHIRKQLGWPEIPNFTNHYIIRPMARWIR